jgi:cell division protein FtsB
MIKKKYLLILILSLFIALGLLTFFGEKGVLRLLHLHKELEEIKRRNLKIEEENRKLMEEVKRLESDKRYIEEIARKELGLIKEDEIIYQFDIAVPEKGGSR